MEDFLEFVEFVGEIEDIQQQRIPKRYIRDTDNPFEFYSETQFKQRYRFSKITVMDLLLPLIDNDLRKLNNRGLPIPAMQQLLIALRFYATGNFQVRNLYEYL